MNNLLFNSFYQMLRIWYWEHCTEGMATETFLRRLKKWEHAGFIHSEVLSNMGDIVDSDVRRSIETSDSISTADGLEKLTQNDIITDRVLICVSRLIVNSRRLQFALEILKIKYYRISKALYPDEMRYFPEVCYQYNVLSFLFCNTVLLRYNIYLVLFLPKG